MRFMGVDLAFVPTNPSGLYVLDEQGTCVGSDYLSSDEELATVIAQRA